MEIVVIILITLISFLLLIKNFELGVKVLLVLSVFLHKEVFSIFRWDFLPVRFFMLALCTFLVYELMRTVMQKRNLKKYLEIAKDPLILIVILLWFVRVASILFSKNLAASVQLLAFFTTIVSLGILLYREYYGHPQKLLGLVKFYIYLALILTGFGFFQFYLYTQHEIIIGALWNIPGHVPRIGSTFWDVNHFAALLACLLPVLGVFLLLEKRIKTRMGYAGMFLIMTGMLALTSSRTSWIIALVAFISFITVLLVRRFGARGLTYVLVTIILFLIPAVREYSIKSSPFRAYIKDNFHYRLDSFAGHIMLLEGSYQIFEEYPILGGGYGSFFEHFSKTDIAPKFFSRDPAALNTRVPAHTIWGEAMSETGIIGLSLLVLFAGTLLTVMLFGALKMSEKKDFLMLAAMFSTILGVFFAGIFYSYNAEFYWLIVFIYYLYSLSIVRKKYSYRQILEYFTKSSKLYLFIIFIISFGLIFVRLGANHLIPWDEAIYAKIAKNMVQKGEYIRMYWWPNRPWFEKPPFAMWGMSLFMNMLGFSSLAARLPSAIFGLGTVLLTYLFSKKLFGKIAGYFSALSLITGIHFLYYSRAAMLDVTTTFFIILSLYLYWLAKEKYRVLYFVLAGVSIGFAAMSKGMIGLLPIVIVFLFEAYLFVFDRKESIKSPILNLGMLIIATLGVALPWHANMYLTYGREFIDMYLIYHVFHRATQAIEDKGQPFFWYATVMRVSMRFWFIPLLGAAPLFIYETLKKRKEYALFLIWFSFTFLLFSASTSKIVWYIIPLYPAAGIMVGVFLDRTYKYLSSRISSLKDPIVLFLGIFVITVINLTYLFYNREMVYTSDLTGAEAELMQFKDRKLGVEDRFYIDRVPLPLVLYYTDSPFRIIDFEPYKGRKPLRHYDNKIIILGKKGRFTEETFFYNKEPTVEAERGDYILWYYESDMWLDEKRLKEIRNELSGLRKNPAANAQEISELEALKQELIARISVFKEVK